MELNYHSIKQAEHFVFDICILGAGIAGIICANELRKKFPQTKICLIESGDFSINNPHNQTLKKLDFSSLSIKDASREFTLGGATSTWGGVTAKFEEFETHGRGFLETHDWPISVTQLNQYYRQAIAQYGFINNLNANSGMQKLFSEFTQRSFKAHSEAINYASYLRDDINLIYNAHVTDIHSSEDPRNISHIEISNLETQIQSPVSAKRFIIALGAIETVKLLLNSHAKNTLSLGSESTWLGRYFMNHPKGDYGTIEFNHYINVEEFVGSGQYGVYQYTGISLNKELQLSKKLLNSYVRLEPIYSWRNDYLVSMFIRAFLGNKWVKQLFLKVYNNKKISMLDYSETGDEDQAHHLEKHSLFKSIAFLSSYVWHRISNSKPKIKTYKLRNFLEMEPRFNNRVTLSEKKDVFGNCRAKVDCSLSERDKRSLIVLHREIANYLEKNQLGKLRSQLAQESDWPIVDDASHHIGGAIMGESPENSFVNPNLRVHSKDNLFICSSAVFPTSGSHNPTFTIAALSCFLAEHIADEMKQQTSAPADIHQKMGEHTKEESKVAAKQSLAENLV